MEKSLMRRTIIGALMARGFAPSSHSPKPGKLIKKFKLSVDASVFLSCLCFHFIFPNVFLFCFFSLAWHDPSTLARCIFAIPDFLFYALPDCPEYKWLLHELCIMPLLSPQMCYTPFWWLTFWTHYPEFIPQQGGQWLWFPDPGHVSVSLIVWLFLCGHVINCQLA